MSIRAGDLRTVGRRARTPALAMMAIALAGCSLPAKLDAAAAESRPGRLAQLQDGRRLNLVCSGRGAPTVILESGFGATSGAWYKVRPALARGVRVCAYDRAGSGFSDPGPLPRDGAAIVRDLDQALTAAKIVGPYVLVGHSAGGLYARLFAARRPGRSRVSFCSIPPSSAVRRSPWATAWMAFADACSVAWRRRKQSHSPR